MFSGYLRFHSWRVPSMDCAVGLATIEGKRY